jgi:hypothetical protein
MVEIVDDAIAMIRGLEETLAQKNTIIERLQREIEGGRTIK